LMVACPLEEPVRGDAFQKAEFDDQCLVELG